MIPILIFSSLVDDGVGVGGIGVEKDEGGGVDIV